MPFIELVAQRRAPTPPAGMQPPENAKDWFRMEASPNDDDSTDIYVYESIGGWFGMWADDFIYQLKSVTTSKINLRLNSPGGSVFDGIAIANALRAHPANVTVYVDSLAASIASVIALAGDRVVMMPQSQFMVHNASGACYGDATEMTKMADLLDKQSLNIAQAYASHTGRPLAEWQDYMTAETWFTAEEAVAVGLADEAMPMRPAKGEDAEEPAAATATARTWDLSMYQYAGRDNAPAPVIAQNPTPFAPGGLVPGQLLTANALNAGGQVAAGMAAGIQLISDTTVPAAASDKPVVSAPDPAAVVGTDEFRDYLRNAIREELAAREAALVAEDEDETAAEDSVQPDDSPAAQADTGSEEQPAAENAAAPKAEAVAPEETPPDDGVVPETHNEADDWIVGFVASPATSPSADDVFAQLKEGW